jgi:hypothetical protein
LIFTSRVGQRERVRAQPNLTAFFFDAADSAACFFRDMTKNLVIVESPAKAKTIKKYLGKDFEVMASYGHVRDLVPKEGAVDPTRNFAMRWELIDKNRKHVDAITRAVKKADALYLSTDPDREGEAISWHLQQLLKEAGALDGKSVHRSVFYEITKNSGAGSGRQPARDRRRTGEGLSRAPRARLPGGLQPVAAAVEEGRPVRRLRGPGAEPRPAHDLRARGRDPRLQAARILVHRCAGGERRARSRRSSRSWVARSRAVHRHATPVAPKRRGRSSSAMQTARWSSRTSKRSSASATLRRRSRRRRCSRRPRANSASARSARCASRSGFTKASTSVKARSASSATCVPTPSISAYRGDARDPRRHRAALR